MSRFGKLIALWERRVDASRQQLGRTMQAIEAAQADIAACESEREQAAGSAASGDVRLREQYRDYCLWSLGREQAHRHNLSAFRSLADEQRQALAEARRQQRSFELLQEREDERLAREERRRREAELVEFATRRWREVT